MQLMEMKAAKEFGDEVDPDLKRDLEAAAKLFHEKMATTQSELEALWTRWDTAVDSRIATLRKLCTSSASAA